MFEPRLSAALAAGSTVVTPNKRLARSLVAAYDNAQRSNGRKTWPAARVLPWPAWLQQLWADVVARDSLRSIDRLLRAPQARRCWQQIVRTTEVSVTNTSGAAELASEAWALSKAWGSGGESWRSFRNDALGDDDCAVYAGWAERYHALLRSLAAIDEASLADALASAADGIDAWRRLDVVVAGFLESTPQRERLIAALSRQGARIQRCETLEARPIRCALTSATSSRDELLHALTWAREEALANPSATIGIAIEDLAQRRSEVIALAEDVLCPGLQLPGRESEMRPYNVSLGESLASASLVASALDWIELGVRPLPFTQAVALLRSPYLPDARLQWPRRAAIELDWLNEGRREIAARDMASALERGDKPQAERFRRAIAANRFPRDASPKAWVDAWRDWLAALGWPGDRALDSGEQQTRDAFDDLLATFAAMSIVDERMRTADAQSALRDLADQTVFQPESSTVSIQIVGLLEATGLPFDRLWIAGLTADRWPRPPSPHPFLPLRWQRDHDVPRSSAARELRFARAATSMLLRAAPQVIVSYAQGPDDDRPPRPSELVAEIGPTTFFPRRTDTRSAAYAQQIYAQRPMLETIVDQKAPSIVEGTRIRGGAHAFEAQANCPFQAITLHRLEAERWPALPAGLTPIERGKLVHAALAAFWSDVRDSPTLSGLDDRALTERIAVACVAARSAVPAARWRWVPPVIEAGETARMASLLRGWIDRFERTRPPFAVEANETRTELALAGLAFRLRIDRIDRTRDGFAIIDYKTGLTLAPKAWFDPRPRSPQIGLYVLARRQSASDSPTRAVAYAQLRSGELKLNGVAANAQIWPALVLAENTALKSWSTLEAWWETQLGALAEEIRNGIAPVAPREGDKTCRTCGLWAICRVGGAVLAREDNRDE